MHIVGARPNFMKMAPIVDAMQSRSGDFEQVLVHTGQHYDSAMSEVFFSDLGMPKPDINLEVGSGTHAEQTALIMQRFEPVLLNYKPDWVLVPGDVNSTLACTLVASKLGVKVAHIEAGLRSFDRTMPEEVNRVVTDHLSTLLFVTEPSGRANLIQEGIPEDRIHFVGNTMIDTLDRLLPKAITRWETLKAELSLNSYVLVTLHRPSNVDNIETLHRIMSSLEEIARETQVVLPLHPRTRQRIDRLMCNNRLLSYADIRMIAPMGYLDFLALQAHATVVVTDSGGVQEETTALDVPCLTVRPNTERPVTVSMGTNRLIDNSQTALTHSIRSVLHTTQGVQQPKGTRHRPPLWDGKASERIVNKLLEVY